MRNKNYNQNPISKILRIILLIILSPIVLIFLMRNFVKNRKNKKLNKDRVKVYQISQIDSLSGVEFEHFLMDMFEKLGFKVKLTPQSKDYGADLIISREKETYIVQAKCYGGTVGVKAVQEVIGARKHYNIYNAMVATNRNFSREATLLASENDVKLIDRETIDAIISKINVKTSKISSNFSAMSDRSKCEIEARYKHWI